MPKPSVAIRLVTEGGAQVKDTFRDIGDAGDAQARRLSRSFEEQSAAAERAASRAAATAAKIAAITSQTPIQARINQQFGGAGAGGDGSARRSAEVFMEMERAEAALEQRTRALLAAIDPLWAAQDRFNRELLEAKTLLDAGRISTDQYAQAELRAKAALDATTMANQRQGQSLGARRAAMQQLSFQVNDVSQAFALGVAPQVIFAQQASQVSQAIQLLNNKTTGFAGFMAGPWGAAILAGVTVLAMLIPKLIGTGDAVEEATKEMEKSAKQAAATREAKERWRHSVAGLVDAIRELDDATAKQILTARQTEEQALQAARDYQIETRSLRELTRAKLEAALAELAWRDARASEQDSGVGALMAARNTENQIAQLKGWIADLDSSIARSDVIVRRLEMPLAERDVAARMDRAAAAADRYERALGRLRGEMERGTISRAKFEAELAKEARRRDAEIKAARDEERTTRDRTISLLAPVDGPVSSGFGMRTRPTRGASAYHPAIDYAVGVGTPVKAGAAGVVVHAGQLRGFGNAVIIDYGNQVMAQFGHLSTLMVKAGDVVDRGQVVARSGNTGITTGPHLDYRLKVRGDYVDPRKPVNIGRGVGDALADREKDIAREAEEAARQLERLREEAGRLQEKFDPAAASAAALKEELARIAALKDAKVITPEDATEWAFLARAASGAKRLADAILPGLEATVKEEEERGRRMKGLGRLGEEQQDRRTLLEMELRLGGLNERQRERALSLRARELELLREYGPEYENQIRLIVAEEAAQGDLADKIEMVRQNLDEARQIGANFVDTLFDPDNWDSWGDLGKKVLHDLERDLIRLALLNPLKNWMFGENNSTLGGILRAIGGAASAAGGLSGSPVKNANALPKYATGTEYSNSGAAWLAENGPELVHLPRGSRVTPAAETRRLLAANDRGGPPLTIVNHNDFRGADSAAVAQIERRLDQQEETLSARVVAIWAEARSRGVIR